MKITYDKTADAMYWRMSKRKVAKTLPINDWLIVDVDKNGSIVGVEMLLTSSVLTQNKIMKLLSS